MARLLPVALILLVAATSARAGSRDPKTSGASAKPGQSGGLGGLRGNVVAPAPVEARVGSVGGQLTATAVQTALKRRLSRLEACVARDRKLAGRVVVQLRVARGRVTVKLRSSTLRRRRPAACLRRALHGLQLAGSGHAELTLHVRQVPGLSGAVGIGGLGLRGSGGSFGTGGPASRPVVIGKGGPLSKDDIRRVIRQHTREVQHCYEKELVKQQALAGRLVVRFTIGGDGKVRAARLTQDTLASPAVGRCVVRRVLTWRFPAPLGGGIVNVSYPFVFRTAP